MKRFLAALFLIVSSPLQAVQIISNTGQVVTASAPNTSDVPFYHNCNSITSGAAPTKGSGTVTIGASYTSVAAQVSNGWQNNNAGNAGGRITFDQANLQMSEGRIGFWIKPAESGSGADGEIFYVQTAAPKLQVTNVTGTYSASYKDISIGTFSGLSSGVWAFLEMAWDSDGDKLGSHLKIFIDGVQNGTASGSTGADPTLAGGKIGSADGNGHSSIVDQVMVSTNPVKDLYALRSETSF